MTKVEQTAEMFGVSVSDVVLFAHLTATQYEKGLEGVEAIKAASATMIQMCNDAGRSILNHDPNHDGYKSPFLSVLYDLLKNPQPAESV